MTVEQTDVMQHLMRSRNEGRLTASAFQDDF